MLLAFSEKLLQRIQKKPPMIMEYIGTKIRPKLKKLGVVRNLKISSIYIIMQGKTKNDAAWFFEKFLKNFLFLITDSVEVTVKNLSLKIVNVLYNFFCYNSTKYNWKIKFNKL